ncbi:hypothetical protein AMECASPLE_038557 [Ameca splendens]|uniref:Uncharacterized protein n=1 Tax=Ameca splendens TaxID=208324 RepID=A0ABV1A4R3_9TELE
MFINRPQSSKHVNQHVNQMRSRKPSTNLRQIKNVHHLTFPQTSTSIAQLQEMISLTPTHVPASFPLAHVLAFFPLGLVFAPQAHVPAAISPTQTAFQTQTEIFI